ncbi:MAG: hypothetical protein K5886_05280 [Lachnospiraceae bacterium]|nr:hypothetical protein [Lachnospiraceae bacterium]
MGNYRNFELVVYFVAKGTEEITKEKLQEEIEFFKKYMRIDKVYLEPYRDSVFASEEQVRMCKEVFLENGIRVEGGLTTCIRDIEGEKKKQRLFDTFCYNDESMLNELKSVSSFLGSMFDAFIIDDFYFTGCTCEKCREEKDKYNKEHGITDGSWQSYRVHRQYEISRDYIIGPAKEKNPEMKITIKYPNWMESYQETGYDPLTQKDIFDYIYTGTETRDPLHTDQHLPRYLSFSLMRYMEDMAPGRNMGGWFDPFDCRLLDYYLEQAYLTAFAKPKEMMMFCFQALVNTVNVPALGFMLDELDRLLDHLGEPVGIPCYIPNGSQGEDNVQDFLGMHGFPVITTPLFKEDEPVMLLTGASAYDEDIIDKLSKYVAAGGKAIVTSGFVKETLDRGLKAMTSIRDRGRIVSVDEFITETQSFYHGFDRSSSKDSVEIPVLEFRNNATWGAVCKALKDEESYTLFARDTYGDGEMYTLVVPEAFSDIQRYPEPVLNRMRQEFSVRGIRLEGPPMISLFVYDNDTFVIMSYADRNTYDADITVFIRKDEDEDIVLKTIMYEREIKPLYVNERGEAAFLLRAFSGKFEGCRIERSRK